MPPKKKPKTSESEEEEEEFQPSFSEDDEDDEPEVMPTKGTRGRPRKGGNRGRKRPLSEDEDEEYQPNKKPKGRARKKTEESEDDDDEEFKPPKKVQAAARKTKTVKKKPKVMAQSLEDPDTEGSAEGAPAPLPSLKTSQSRTDWSTIDLSSDAKTKDDKPWTHKFSSWNVNGIKAWLKSDGLEYIKQECPDIFCLQETKCAENDLPKSDLEVPGYHTYWCSAEKKGYSGTGMYCKEEPINVTYGIGIDKHDNEGRVITAEFEEFYFITAYVPNAGDKLKRLDYRVGEWDPDFRSYLQTLDKTKPIILCGDLNVAHNEIDLANPKTNQKTSGFTKEERASFTTLLEESKFVDSFRHLYPDKKDTYSYWSYRSNARANNKGWRLDYFVISDRLVDNLCDSIIRPQVYGSDHCPIVLLLAL